MKRKQRYYCYMCGRGPPVSNACFQDERNSRRMLQQAADEVHDPSYYQYTLAGILVHRGVADHGHYYSFIKQRDGTNVSDLLLMKT